MESIQVEEASHMITAHKWAIWPIMLVVYLYGWYRECCHLQSGAGEPQDQLATAAFEGYLHWT